MIYPRSREQHTETSSSTGCAAEFPANALDDAAINAMALSIVEGLGGISISQAEVILDRARLIVVTTQRISLSSADFVRAAEGFRDASR